MFSRVTTFVAGNIRQGSYISSEFGIYLFAENFWEPASPMSLIASTLKIVPNIGAARVRLAMAGLAVAGVILGSGSASATAVALGVASNYGLLTGVNEVTKLNGGFHLTGNLGLTSGFNVTISGSNSQSGTTYYDNENGQGSWNDSGTYTTGYASVEESMTSVVSAALSAQSAATADAATAGLTDQNGSISLSGQTLTINAVTNLSENVLDISSLSLLNSTLIFNDNGYTGAKFIINVTGGAFTVNSTGSGKSVISGTNGASASDILFNIEGSSNAVSITGNSTNSIIGTILAPTENVTIGGGGSLTGEIVAGVNSASKGYTVTEQSSGFNITSFAYVPQATKVPEPASIALFGTGVLAIGYFRRRARRA
jgi:hypothetical protein